jgi:hypothetical protein
MVSCSSSSDFNSPQKTAADLSYTTFKTDCYKRLHQRGNQNPYIEEEQTTQWPNEKVQKDKQWSTKHAHKTKDRATRTPLKTGGELRCSGRVSSSCSINLLHYIIKSYHRHNFLFSFNIWLAARVLVISIVHRRQLLIWATPLLRPTVIKGYATLSSDRTKLEVMSRWILL